MPDWDSTERRDSEEDAKWRDLIARFDVPAAAGEPSPWPDREDPGRDGAAGTAEGSAVAGGEAVTGSEAVAEGGAVTGAVTEGVASSGLGRAVDPEEEHFVPPPPPPLPRLEPLTKAAWAGLFGGPGYLLVATAANWSIPGIAVFCAIAAFVGGVALLVLRLNDSDPPSAGDDDDGAVV